MDADETAQLPHGPGKTVVTQRLLYWRRLNQGDAFVLGTKYDGEQTNRKIAIMKFLMVDDHVLIREGLRGVLQGAELRKELTDDAVVLEAANCCEAMQLIAEHPDIDLVMLDLNLPDRDGFSVLAELRERYPAMTVVVLSGQT